MAAGKKLKIAFLHPDLGIGGAERLVLDAAAALRQQNHEILFVTNHYDKDHAFEELQNGEFPVIVWGDWLPRSTFGKFQALWAYIRMIYLTVMFVLFGQGQHPPDLYFIDLIPIAIPFLKLFGKKVVYYCHHPDLLASPPGGSLKKLYRKPIDFIEVKSTKMADVILVNSAYTASVFKRTFPEIDKPIQILYPTIAQSYQHSVATLQHVKPIQELVPQIGHNKPTVFLSVNRFHPAKKLDFAINAMAKLKIQLSAADWSKTYCILAGGYDPVNPTNASTYKELVNLASQLNVADQIIFLKSPSDKEKVHLLSSCTALLYTPLKEHFGIVPLEAMLASKPVLAMNSGGPRETVDHGVTGYLCEENADSLAEFMLRIIGADVKKMGENGKKRLEEKFSQRKFKAGLKRVIDDVVSDKAK